jgi:phage-related protein|tara:strand:- start:3933 stop:4079 length:147 start_codon:yes stop_codon:yes gene_type:complete
VTARVYLQNLKVKLSSEKKVNPFLLEHWGAKSYTQINPLEIKDLEVIE